MKKLLVSTAALIFWTTLAFGVDKPGGLTSTAEGMATNTYEVLLSPAYAISPGGAYLSSELRMQPWEDVGIAAGFGAGELGFNFGGNATWYIAPDLSGQPAFALKGGMYFNRVSSLNYFVIEVAPTVSKTFRTSWSNITPYMGVPVGPSFSLGGLATNQFTIKASTGVEFDVKSMKGLRLWTEFGFGILNSVHEIVLGVSYPFNGLAG